MANIIDKFDKVFNSVMNKHNIDHWWELFDSNLFSEVEKRCQKYIKTEDDQYLYDNWVEEMENDL